VASSPELKIQESNGRSFRHVYDSWVQLLVPLASNKVFRRAFQDVDGSARVGRILELADGLSADVGYRHSFPGGYRKGAPLSVATASIDSLFLGGGRSFTDHHDIVLRAYVSRVGSSSMEVCVEIEQVDTSIRAHVFFVMVARDFATNQAVQVPLLSGLPKAVVGEGGRRQARRQLVRSHSLDVGNTPGSANLTEEDLRDLHELWRQLYHNRRFPSSQSSHLPVGAVPKGRTSLKLLEDEQRMSEHRLESTQLIWPNEMNVHGTVFGGVVTRTAVEVSYMTVAQYVHSTAWAELVCLDDVFFLNPIPSGAMTKYVGQVVYTVGMDVVVRVECLLVPPKQHPVVWQRGTVFYFHFRWPPIVPRVVPESYEEYLLYMEGRRRHRQYVSQESKL